MSVNVFSLKTDKNAHRLCIINAMKQINYKYNDHMTHKPRMSDYTKEVQVGKDQEKAQPEKDSHSKNRGGKKPN